MVAVLMWTVDTGVIVVILGGSVAVALRNRELVKPCSFTWE